MNVKYFEDTATLYLEFSDRVSAETRELDENTLLDYDKDGCLVAMTLENARGFVSVENFSFQHILPSLELSGKVPSYPKGRSGRAKSVLRK